MAKDDKPLDRRAFFRRGLGELLKPLASALEPVERTLDHLERIDRMGKSKATASDANKTMPLPMVLRPPGALKEQQFVETCSRSGECVEACPADAIKLDRAGRQGRGAAYIDASDRACVACDGLHCMQVCPSGALVPTPLNLIKMGTAVWREHTCVRTTKGESCQICVDVCPMGTAAIALNGPEIEVKPLGCIGCGLCQQDCPTDPKSITVIPKAARELV